MKFLKWAGGIILTLIFLTLVWGVVIEPRMIDVVRQDAVIPDLPVEWEGKKFGVISDFQIGMWGDNEGTVKRAVQQMTNLDLDFIVILGDFIYHAPSGNEDESQKAADMLVPLINSGKPVYAVLGNHDYGVNSVGEKPDLELAQQLEQKLTEIGIIVLKNESREIPLINGSSSIQLVGLGAHQPLLDDVQLAFSNVSQRQARIVIMHNPATYQQIPANFAPLAMAGHTHGGQVRIPFTPEWSMLTFVESEPVHVDGWIENYGQAGNQLYVNRGIGFSLFPIRINCVPEITIFTLKQAR